MRNTFEQLEMCKWPSYSRCCMISVITSALTDERMAGQPSFRQDSVSTTSVWQKSCRGKEELSWLTVSERFQFFILGKGWWWGHVAERTCILELDAENMRPREGYSQTQQLSHSGLLPVSRLNLLKMPQLPKLGQSIQSITYRAHISDLRWQFARFGAGLCAIK